MSLTNNNFMYLCGACQPVTGRQITKWFRDDLYNFTELIDDERSIAVIQAQRSTFVEPSSVLTRPYDLHCPIEGLAMRRYYCASSTLRDEILEDLYAACETDPALVSGDEDLTLHEFIMSHPASPCEILHKDDINWRSLDTIFIYDNGEWVNLFGLMK